MVFGDSLLFDTSAEIGDSNKSIYIGLAVENGGPVGSIFFHPPTFEVMNMLQPELARWRYSRRVALPIWLSPISSSEVHLNKSLSGDGFGTFFSFVLFVLLVLRGPFPLFESFFDFDALTFLLTGVPA